MQVIDAAVTNTNSFWEPKTFERVVTKVLFKKNIEQRRPLYYACLCGHERAIEFFSKLYVVAASRRLSGCEAFDDVVNEKGSDATHWKCASNGHHAVLLSHLDPPTFSSVQ